MVFTPVGDSVVAKRVYRNCPIMLPNRVTHVELVELDIFDFDVILSIYWLHACFASIDFIKSMVKFNFSNERVLEWTEGNFTPKSLTISCLKACKIIYKGCFYHIVRV